MDSRLTIYGQEKLKPDVRDAALAAAHAVLSREGVTPAAAVQAAGVDLLLAEGLEPDDRIDAHFREHGATLRAAEAHSVAVAAAQVEIARLDPDNAEFHVLFSMSA
ncbi:MAG TPA: hypothetical protein VN034_06515 [Sphingopyxis sp.]|nr:hypothetical protein [Sphingopyxis sp.]